MGELLNWEGLAVFLSVCGAGCWWCALGVRRSPSWGESAGLKRVELGVGGAVLQIPAVVVAVIRPPYVTGAYAVEPFAPGRLLVE